MRLRILICLLLLSIIPMIVAKTLFLSEYTDREILSRGTEVQGQGTILAAQLASSNYLHEKSQTIEAEIEQMAAMLDGRILVIDKDFKIVQDTYRQDQNKYLIAEEVVNCFLGENTNRMAGDRYREITVPILEGTNITGVVLISSSIDGILDNRDKLNERFDRIITIIAAVILVMAMVITWLLVKPLGKVIRYLENFSLGHDDTEMAISEYMETEQISRSFNRTVKQLRALDESRQEFVSNVSHELKTPLTSMKILADSLNMQENVPNELYKEFMNDITAEIDRENNIITDLLSLVKMDKKAADVNISQVDVGDMMELILKRLRPIAAKGNIEVVLETVRPVIAEIDETKLTLAFTNLVENAIKYNKENGWVHVTLDADHKFFYVKIEDSGIGIPEEARQHIFERFYRVDKSHSREIGGTGLGLAITKSTILLHRGAIRVQSEVGQGTTFTVRIPLNYTP